MVMSTTVPGVNYDENGLNGDEIAALESSFHINFDSADNLYVASPAMAFNTCRS